MTTFNKISDRCRDLGISLSELCRRADVGRATLEYWKRSEPQTLQMYFKIENILNELENERNKSPWLPNGSRRRNQGKF